jgi:uncharacterized protein
MMKKLIEKKQEHRTKLILNKLDQVYCRLAPSPIHGVGIFAIRTIPLGTNPFNNSFMAQGAIVVKKDKIENPTIRKLLDDYHPTANETEQIVSDFPNQLIWTNYINYSDTPNIELMLNGEWETLREIQIGEELLEDPNRLHNPDGTQKVFQIKPGQYPTLQ